MGVRTRMFTHAADIDDFLESRDDIDYIDLKVMSDDTCILVYEEVPVEGITLVKGFENTSV